MPEGWRGKIKIGMIAAVLLSALFYLALRTSSPPPPTDGLRNYTLTLIRLPLRSWSGFGVYLGGGRILTAEHVIGDLRKSKPYAEIAGVTLPTTLIKRGNFVDVDLAELAVDPRALPASVGSLAPLPICPADPAIGTPVVVVTPKQIAPSHIISNTQLPPWLFSSAEIAKYPTLIADVYSTGNSGSGVFDAGSGCLLGIMSRKIELTRTQLVEGLPVKHVEPLAKFFVGPMVVRQFLRASDPP